MTRGKGEKSSTSRLFIDDDLEMSLDDAHLDHTDDDDEQGNNVTEPVPSYKIQFRGILLMGVFHPIRRVPA